VNVLLVGGGGREHALAWKLAQSALLDRLIAAPGNPGIAAHAACVPIKETAFGELTGLAHREHVELVVIGPEIPLALGLADHLRRAGFAVFGPSQSAARIESSKAFAKALMARHGIPTARFSTFTDAAAARAYCRKIGSPLVVKTDGLAAGKGALVCRTPSEADGAVSLCLEAGGFAEAGRTIVIEEFMEGEEVSFFVLSDGTNSVPFGAAQDHKAVFDDDQGPNTGGMGAYTPAPVFDQSMQERVMSEIVEPVIDAMRREGAPYQGALYVGLMITRDGPRVVEFNCRFGDPECQVILPRLDEDLLPLLLSVAIGERLPSTVAWRAESSVCVVLASGGYPGSYEIGYHISGVAEAARLPDTMIFHAGTATRDGVLVTAGGRVLGVQALGVDVADAIDRAYTAAARIAFPGVHCRKDIGRRAIGRP